MPNAATKALAAPAHHTAFPACTRWHVSEDGKDAVPHPEALEKLLVLSAKCGFRAPLGLASEQRILPSQHPQGWLFFIHGEQIQCVENVKSHGEKKKWQRAGMEGPQPKAEGLSAALSLPHGVATSLRIFSILIYKRGLATMPHRAVMRIRGNEIVTRMKSNQRVIAITATFLGTFSCDCRP